MNIKTLLLGSVAAAGMSSAAFAADMPQAMTSLDVCDALGLSGLTISSDTNCVQISGSVEYKFKWGDYSSTNFAGWFNSEMGVHNSNTNYTVDTGNGDTNWYSMVDTRLNIMATADSDFGPAKAVIKLKQKNESDNGNSNTNYIVRVDQAYVSVGDSTVLMAGKKDSIANSGDDTPFNYLGLFNSEAVNTGVYWDNGGTLNASATTSITTGGEVIQVVSDLGNGVSIGAGLEDLAASSGTFVGVMNYAGDNLTGHITVLANNVLDNTASTHDWAIHAGATATMDNFKIRGAVAANSNSYWNALISGEADFDMFTIAASAEATSEDEWGAGASVSAKLTDTVTLNAGARYYNWNTNFSNLDGWEAAVALTADVSETLSVTGKIGMLQSGSSFPAGLSNWTGTHNVTYGSVGATWTPGGGFTASLTGEANSESAYKVTFDAKKTFE